MNHSPLEAAVDIFRHLGWENATPDDAPKLPLGTIAEQRIAKDGLRQGPWGEFGITNEGYGWINFTGVNTTMLALYALRVGVPARRLIQLQNNLQNIDHHLLAQLIEARGLTFATTITQAGGIVFQGVAELLVPAHQLPIPAQKNYLSRWADTFRQRMRTQPHPTAEPETHWVMDRVPDHVKLCLEHRISPATVGPVVTDAVRDGCLDRGTAVDWVIGALDAATRSMDRSVWAKTLVNGLQLTAEEACLNAPHLMGALSHSEGVVVELLVPQLMRLTDEDLLGEVLLLGLHTSSVQATTTVLKLAARQPRPHQNVIDLVAPRVLELAVSLRPAAAQTAIKLAAHWSLEVNETTTDLVMRGIWQATPPRWEHPRFEALDPTPENVTQAGLALRHRGAHEIHDLAVEEFLAAANALAYHNPQAARTALQGLAIWSTTGLEFIDTWVNRRSVFPTGLDYVVADDHTIIPRYTHQPAQARDAVICRDLGSQPVLLSTPTWVDLSIDPSDLITRLKQYHSTRTPVQEADLYLALLRTDAARATEEIHTELEKLTIPVLLQLGDTMPLTAGPLISAYLHHPYQWDVSTTKIPEVLEEYFPPRLAHDDGFRRAELDEYPRGGGSQHVIQRRHSSPHLGMILRQVARSAVPLDPGAAINLLGAARSPQHPASTECAVAIHEAWQRGLLIPGVADITMLDAEAGPSKLAALTTAFGKLADEGLLSVIWPILDDIMQLSASKLKHLAGTSDVIQLITELLPTVQHAIQQGIAPKAALDLPGVRQFAAKKSTSETVRAARAIVAQLPDIPARPAPERTVPFEEVWLDLPHHRAITDGIPFSATWQDTGRQHRELLLSCSLPEHPELTYYFLLPHYYSGERVWNWLHIWGKAPTPDSPLSTQTGWVRHTMWWNDHSQQLKIVQERYDSVELQSFITALLTGDALEENDIQNARRWSPMMVALLLASACQDRARRGGPNVQSLGAVCGPAEVRAAVRTLLGQPAIDPGRLMRLLEKTDTPLSLYWPLLTETIRYAATLPQSPAWINRVLDVALHHAPTLKEAAQRGLIPAEDATWVGLTELTQGKKSTATTKAQYLHDHLNPTVKAT